LSILCERLIIGHHWLQAKMKLELKKSCPRFVSHESYPFQEESDVGYIIKS